MSRTRSLIGLTAVTHLASAAVAEFYHTKNPTRTHGSTRCGSTAPDGSVAHYVLTLVALPHITTDPHLNGESSEAPGTDPA